MCPHVFFPITPHSEPYGPCSHLLIPRVSIRRDPNAFFLPIPFQPRPFLQLLPSPFLRPDPAKWTHAGTFLSTHSDIQTSAHCLQLHSPIALSMLCSYHSLSQSNDAQTPAVMFAPACLPEFVPPLEVAPRPVAFIVRSVEAAAWSFNYYGDQVAWPQTPVSRCLIDYLDSSLTRRPSLSHSSFI